MLPPNSEAKKKHLIIVGQPRSGTVIFWKTFRQDRRFLCFNEPFHPLIRHHAEKAVDSHKKTRAEYAGYANLVRDYWSTIQPYQETYTRLLGHQRVSVNELVNANEHTCLKVLRCCAKLTDLRVAAPDALIVHLVRDPRACVSSHLRPYGKWLKGLPERFFRHDGWFDFWSRQRIADYLGLQGYAHEKLLHIWSDAVSAAEAGAPDMTVQFENFALDPEPIVKQIYERLALDYRGLDYSKIRRPNPPFQIANCEWQKALERHIAEDNHRFIFNFPSAHAPNNTDVAERRGSAIDARPTFQRNVNSRLSLTD